MNNTRKSIVSACVGLAAIGITAGVQCIGVLSDRIKDLEDEKEIRRLESLKYGLSVDELIDGLTNRHNSYMIREWYRSRLREIDRESNNRLNEFQSKLISCECDISALRVSLKQDEN